MKPLALSLAAFALAVALQAQTAPPATGTPRPPWQPRPMIIVDPHDVLTSPAPSPAHTVSPKHRATPRPRATPAHRRSAASPPPELFERYDTSPTPRP